MSTYPVCSRVIIPFLYKPVKSSSFANILEIGIFQYNIICNVIFCSCCACTFDRLASYTKFNYMPVYSYSVLWSVL